MTNEEYEKIKAGAKFTYWSSVYRYVGDLKSTVYRFKFIGVSEGVDEMVLPFNTKDEIELVKTKHVKYINLYYETEEQVFDTEDEARNYQRGMTNVPVARIEWEE